MELKGNLEEGTKFYNDLHAAAGHHQNKVNDFTLPRKTEKEELLKDMYSSLAGMSMDAPPRRRVITLQTHLPPVLLEGGSPARPAAPPNVAPATDASRPPEPVTRTVEHRVPLPPHPGPTNHADAVQSIHTRQEATTLTTSPAQPNIPPTRPGSFTSRAIHPPRLPAESSQVAGTRRTPAPGYQAYPPQYPQQFQVPGQQPGYPAAARIPTMDTSNRGHIFRYVNGIISGYVFNI